jgi:hypothetical protein
LKLVKATCKLLADTAAEELETSFSDEVLKILIKNKGLKTTET